MQVDPEGVRRVTPAAMRLIAAASSGNNEVIARELDEVQDHDRASLLFVLAKAPSIVARMAEARLATEDIAIDRRQLLAVSMDALEEALDELADAMDSDPPKA